MNNEPNKETNPIVIDDPERKGATPSYWRDWAFGLAVMGSVTLLAAETGTARPVGALLLGFGAVIGAVAVGKRIAGWVRRVLDTKPLEPYGSHPL